MLILAIVPYCKIPSKHLEEGNQELLLTRQLTKQAVKKIFGETDVKSLVFSWHCWENLDIKISLQYFLVCGI